jgi:hypothetical protein
MLLRLPRNNFYFLPIVDLKLAMVPGTDKKEEDVHQEIHPKGLYDPYLLTLIAYKKEFFIVCLKVRSYFYKF